MNEELTEVRMLPSQEELDSAAAPGSTIELRFRADAPCRLYTVFVESIAWTLEQITLCRRLAVWGPSHWGVGAVMLPGQTLEVVIKNRCWEPSMMRPEVKLEFYAQALGDDLQKAKNSFLQRVRAREEEIRRAKPLLPSSLTQENYEKYMRALRGAPEITDKWKPEPPAPTPTRFSELDIEDDE